MGHPVSICMDTIYIECVKFKGIILKKINASFIIHFSLDKYNFIF